MGILNAIAVFVVSLLVGGLGIYVGARFIAGVDDYSHAVFTAAIGALAWAIGSLVPIIGGIVAFLAYLWVVNRRYPGGWVNAVLITLVAWLTVFVVMWVLSALNVPFFGAVGVPGF